MDSPQPRPPAAAEPAVTLRRSQNELALLAADVLRRRHRHGRYEQLSAAALNRVANALTGAATGQHPLAAHGEEVAAFAHRILDDDHPELDPLWPAPATQRRETQLSDPRDLPDDGHCQGPMLGASAPTPVGGWR